MCNVSQYHISTANDDVLHSLWPRLVIDMSRLGKNIIVWEKSTNPGSVGVRRFSVLYMKVVWFWWYKPWYLFLIRVEIQSFDRAALVIVTHYLKLVLGVPTGPCWIRTVQLSASISMEKTPIQLKKAWDPHRPWENVTIRKLQWIGSSIRVGVCVNLIPSRDNIVNLDRDLIFPWIENK